MPADEDGPRGTGRITGPLRREAPAPAPTLELLLLLVVVTRVRAPTPHLLRLLRPSLRMPVSASGTYLLPVSRALNQLPTLLRHFL